MGLVGGSRRILEVTELGARIVALEVQKISFETPFWRATRFHPPQR